MPVKIVTDIYKIKAKAQNKINIELIKKILKRAGSLVLIVPFILAQVVLLSAYEAHVINVTAHICQYSETRTPGYWKTHEEITTQLLPKTLGCDEPITTFSEAFDVLDSNAKDMRDKLKSQLLAMKFNIDYYDIGNIYIESCDGKPIYKTINELVARADALLCDPDTKRKDLEDIKNMLDCINNLHKISQCATPTALFNILNSNVQMEISNEITTNEGKQIIIPKSTKGQVEEQISPPPSEEIPPPEETPPDTTPPVITLIDSDTINIYVGDSYIDPGATASDDVDGDITAKIIVVNPVDTNTADTYNITYNVSDTAGNSATEVTRTVIVSEKPQPPETIP